MNAGSGAGEEDDELAAAMREARERFVASFSGRCDEIQSGLTAEGGDGPVPDGARQAIHRLAGLAGTVGFPEVSRIASEMEGALFKATANRSQLLAAVASMREAFQRAIDVSLPNARMTPKAATGQRVLVVDDDPEQRRLITRALEIGGYNVTVLPLADTVIETAERVRPAAILLDVMMPGINGHLACRLLKAEPSVADVPILFVSSNSALDERLAGLAAGAVDYVAKPFDFNELLFRVTRAIEHKPAPVAPPAALDDVLEYEEFTGRAAAALAHGPCTLALVRVDPPSLERLARTLVAESRRRDLVARFDRLHLVVLLPDVAPAAATVQLGALLERLTQEGVDARAGLAGSAANETRLDSLIQEADEGLAAARFHGSLLSQKGVPTATLPSAGPLQLILLADDDPEVTRIVDAQMRSLHFATTLAFDGQATLAALSARRVSLLILDLMLPKVTGFEILHQLQATPESRPRLIVLSARGREEDITRAFELGADDYMTKPFRPQELAARVVRLLR